MRNQNEYPQFLYVIQASSFLINNKKKNCSGSINHHGDPGHLQIA